MGKQYGSHVRSPFSFGTGGKEKEHADSLCSINNIDLTAVSPGLGYLGMGSLGILL